MILKAATLLALLLALSPAAALARVSAGAGDFGPYVVVKVKNGPSLRGRVVSVGEDSITLSVDDIDCKIKVAADEIDSYYLLTSDAGGKPTRTRASREIKVSPQALDALRRQVSSHDLAETRPGGGSAARPHR